MAQKQKGVADAVIKAKLHTPYQNLIQQHIQQGLKNKELSHSMHFLSVHGIVRSWRRRGLSGQAKTYSRAYAYLKKRSQWMRCRSYRRQHLPIGVGSQKPPVKSSSRSASSAR